MESSECIPMHEKYWGKLHKTAGVPQLMQKFNYSLCFLGVKGTLRTSHSMAATWGKRATVQNALENQENALKQHLRETELLKEDVERTDRKCDPSSSLGGWKSLGLSPQSILSGSYSLSVLFPVPSSLPQHHTESSTATQSSSHSKESLISIKHSARMRLVIAGDFLAPPPVAFCSDVTVDRIFTSTQPRVLWHSWCVEEDRKAPSAGMFSILPDFGQDCRTHRSSCSNQRGLVELFIYQISQHLFPLVTFLSGMPGLYLHPGTSSYSWLFWVAQCFSTEPPRAVRITICLSSNSSSLSQLEVLFAMLFYQFCFIRPLIKL